MIRKNTDLWKRYDGSSTKKKLITWNWNTWVLITINWFILLQHLWLYWLYTQPFWGRSASDAQEIVSCFNIHKKTMKWNQIKTAIIYNAIFFCADRKSNQHKYDSKKIHSGKWSEKWIFVSWSCSIASNRSVIQINNIKISLALLWMPSIEKKSHLHHHHLVDWIYICKRIFVFWLFLFWK